MYKTKATVVMDSHCVKIFQSQSIQDSAICVNDEDVLYDEMYYTEELDHLPVIGTVSTSEGLLVINLLCSNWKDRNEPNWIAEVQK